MGIEIERKFLMNPEKWEHLEKPLGEFYRQGYLLTDPTKTILTIKGISVGATRKEYEYEIPLEEAKELLDQFSVAELSKIRYKISIGNHVWEVDEFSGKNAGLIVAEIELTSEDEDFEIPDWIGREVTGAEKYYNSNLVTEPYENWK